MLETSRLAASYGRYTSTVSTPQMAASLKTSAVALSAATTLRVERLIDLGSGFSSAVLRLAQRELAERGVTVEVVSVDDSEEWLTRTADFLRNEGLSSEGLVHVDDFRPDSMPIPSVVFHDLAMGERREQYMAAALSAATPNGVVLFDDMQHASHRTRAYQESRAVGFVACSLYERTVDDIGRWSMLAAGSNAAARSVAA